MRVAIKVVIAMARLRRHKPDNTSRRSTAEATPLAKDRISESCIAVPHGLTTSEIERVIGDRLRAGFLRNPSVAVQVVGTRPFFILGQVNQAGGFPYQTGMTVQNAIAIAGGYTPRADEGAVLVTRKSADGTRTFRVPVTTYVYPGDTIYIRERWF
jgi:SLBB domain